MIDNLPLHIYLQRSEKALQTQSSMQRQRATEVDFRAFTRRDLVLLLFNLRNYIMKTRELQFNYQSFISYILDPDVIPTNVKLNGCTPEQHKMFIKLIALHQDFVSKRSLRRCIYSFKLPGQKIPLIPFIPSQRLFGHQGAGSEHSLSASDHRVRELSYLNFMPGSQLKQQAKIWSDNKVSASQGLQEF